MSLRFQRTRGAAADIKELEYIVALHQTTTTTARHTTATVTSVDVHRFLRSRYALSPKAVSQRDIAELLTSLGGCEDHSLSSEKNGLKKRYFLNLSRQNVPDSHNNVSELTSDLLKESSSFPAKQDTSALHNELVDASNIAASMDHETGVTATNEHGNVEDDDAVDTMERNNEERLQENPVGEKTLNSSPLPTRLKNVSKDAHCQLDLVQLVFLLLIPTFAAASHISREGVKPMHIPEPRGDSLSGKILGWIDRIRSIPIQYMYASYKSTLPNVDFISDTWRCLVTGSDRDLEVNEEMVRRLLIRHGEVNRAKDAGLVKEMVAMAQSTSGRLDSNAWLQALSSDLSDWNIENETSLSSFFQDVFGESDPGAVYLVDHNMERQETGRRPDEEEAECLKPQVALEPQTNFFSFAKKNVVQLFRPERTNIDLVVDTHASLIAVVLVWLFYLFGFIVYGSLLVITIYSTSRCDYTKFSCQVSSTVVTWVTLAVLLSVAGVFVIAPMSYGNNPFKANIFRTVCSVAFSAVYGCIPLVAVRNYNDYDKAIREIVEGDAFQAGQAITLAICLVLVVFYGLNWVLSWIRSFVSTEFRALKYFLSTSNMRGEVCLKFAGSRKVNQMIENARVLHRHHPSRESTEDNLAISQREAFRRFLGQTEQYEPCGGFFWTWVRIFNGELFSTEGVWIHTRLLIMQVAQIVVGVFFGLAVFLFVSRVADEAQEAIASLPANTPEWVVDLFPTKDMIKRSFYPSAVLAIAAELFLILIYIPSATTTVLKYRNQTLPSFRSQYFHKYRNGVDSAYMNAANGVWCMIGSATLIFFIFGILLFFFQWPYSQKVMLLILGWSIGLTVTISLKMLLTTGCRSFQYRSFFRIRPGAARMSSLALECWYFGLASSTALGRVLQFLFAASLWVGRIDVNFLAEEVNLLGYSFDYVPSSFVKDLLVHEAHRHPFMERLAQMYLMKLKHPDSFGTRVGAAWRQLAVVALFPWMSHYRLLEREVDFSQRDEEDVVSCSSDDSASGLDLYEETQQMLQDVADTVRIQSSLDVVYKAADRLHEMADKAENRLINSRVEL